MLYNTVRAFSLRKRQNRSRPNSVRPSFRPSLEPLEGRFVPTTLASFTSPTTIANSQHSSPYDGSFILDYAIDHSTYGNGAPGSAGTTSSYGNSDAAWISEQTISNQPEYSALYYSQMNFLGAATGPTLVAHDYFDAYGRFSSGINLNGVDNNDIDIAVSSNGSFAIAYIINTASYANNTTTTPNATTETLYVSEYQANGTLLSTSPVGSPTATTSTDPTRRFLSDPKIGIDSIGNVTVAWSNTTQVDPVGTTHGSETIYLYEARSGSLSTQVPLATSSLDVGTLGFGSPSGWVGNRVLRLDIATNASGESIVVWGNFVNITGVSSEYMALDAVYGQEVDYTGSLVGSPFTVSQNADTYEPNADPKVALNDSGAFVIDWVYVPPYTISSLPATRGVYARLYNSSGPVTSEFLVVSSPETVYVYHNPFYTETIVYYLDIMDHPVGIDANGDYVVGYDQETNGTTGPTHSRVVVQAYSAGGSTQSVLASIATDGSPITTGAGNFNLAMAEDGTFVAVGQEPTPPAGNDEAFFAWLWRLS